MKRQESMRALIRRLTSDDAGQDLIEYALLGTFIGLVGVVAFNVFSGVLQVVYQSWDTSVQNSWEVSPPSGGS